MSKSLFQDITDFFRNGNMVTKIILVNIVLTIIVLLSGAIMHLDIYKYFLLSNDLIWDVKHPWVIITHLFVSRNIMDLIWNMVILYWFGAILGDLIGDKKILPLYVLGGLSGAIVFILLSLIDGNKGTSYLISGSNSAVVAIIVSSAVLVPDYKIKLLIFGVVSLKIIAFIYVGLQILYSVSSGNLVYYSYAGSVIFGWFYIYSIRKGKRIDDDFNSIVERIKAILFLKKRKQKRNLSVKYKSKNSFNSRNSLNDIKSKKEKELDRILDKIKLSGYDSLTDIEKEFLFLASKD